MSRTSRENLALRTTERWRPPSFAPDTDRRGRVKAAVRRLVDLQAGSLWRDLSEPLSQARGTLLDVGCGAQPYRRLIPPGTTYIGLDTEESEVHFGYATPDVRRIALDGVWPVGDRCADIVLATETLEHVQNPDTFLAQAHRCLRPGGRLILTVPFAARWHYIPHDYWRFTPSGLRLLLERARFTDVAVHGRGNERTVACYKLLSLLLPIAFPQAHPGSVRMRPLALLILPLIVALAVIGNCSLRMPPGDDCLGYTVFATRT
ncbi:MAG: class I SAM-dependent methyltransferase [Chloroflexi bacterium]|nr:class I SAM-dependent methyltransferase [Chloroflexota bacterium]